MHVHIYTERPQSPNKAKPGCMAEGRLKRERVKEKTHALCGRHGSPYLNKMESQALLVAQVL